MNLGLSPAFVTGIAGTLPSRAVCVLPVGNGEGNKERIPRWEPGRGPE